MSDDLVKQAASAALDLHQSDNADVLKLRGLVLKLADALEAYEEEIEQLRSPPGGPGATHWEGCWRARGHHECAVAEIERLREELDRTVNDDIEINHDLHAKLDVAESQSRALRSNHDRALDKIGRASCRERV